MVCVEDEDEIARQLRQHAVDVAGLRMRVVGTRGVLEAERGREVPHPVASSIVEDPDRHAAAHLRASDERRLEDHSSLVKGRNEYVDGHVEWRLTPGGQHAPCLMSVQDQADPPEGLGPDQQPEHPGRGAISRVERTPREVEAPQEDRQHRDAVHPLGWPMRRDQRIEDGDLLVALHRTVVTAHAATDSVLGAVGAAGIEDLLGLVRAGDRESGRIE